MAGTIDSAVISKNDRVVEKEAKVEQAEAEARREEDRRIGPQEQAPGEMPPENHEHHD